jgi:hypothetical protein
MKMLFTEMNKINIIKPTASLSQITPIVITTSHLVSSRERMWKLFYFQRLPCTSWEASLCLTSQRAQNIIGLAHMTKKAWEASISFGSVQALNKAELWLLSRREQRLEFALASLNCQRGPPILRRTYVCPTNNA